MISQEDNPSFDIEHQVPDAFANINRFTEYRPGILHVNTEDRFTPHRPDNQVTVPSFKYAPVNTDQIRYTY